jgi:hypothetical protein
MRCFEGFDHARKRADDLRPAPPWVPDKRLVRFAEGLSTQCVKPDAQEVSAKLCDLRKWGHALGTEHGREENQRPLHVLMRPGVEESPNRKHQQVPKAHETETQE